MTGHCVKHGFYPPLEWCPECADEPERVRCGVCFDMKPADAAKYIETWLGDLWVCWHCQCDHETGEPTDDFTRWVGDWKIK